MYNLLVCVVLCSYNLSSKVWSEISHRIGKKNTIKDAILLTFGYLLIKFRLISVVDIRKSRIQFNGLG